MTTRTPDPRISKPHPHKRAYRCQYKTPAGAWRHGPTAPTAEEAVLLARQVVALQEHESGQTVAACIEAYLADHTDKGSRPRTIVRYRQTLGRFFASVLQRPLGYVTAARGAALYEALRKDTGIRTGRPLAVDTHRNALGVAKVFLSWCKTKKKIRANPLAEVKAIGPKRRGKAQPTIDEARTLWQTCVREAEAGDVGALAAAMTLPMALRAGEIVSRTVRDLDNKGPDGLPQHLRVQDQDSVGWETKTKSSKRPVLIPEEIRALLVAQARDKLPGALLFPSAVGKLQHTTWINRHVHRLCALAGIPPFCAHALRGAGATLAAGVGDSPQKVATLLGHSNTSVTMAHYIKPGTVEQVELAQGLKVLRGGK